MVLGHQNKIMHDAICDKEQNLIERYGGAQSHQGVSGNVYSGIDDNNSEKAIYLDVPLKKFGEAEDKI